MKQLHRVDAVPVRSVKARRSGTDTDRRGQGAEMIGHRRIYGFPAGLLETNAYGDGVGGVYLESFQRGTSDEREPRGEEIRWKPTCLGYLRTDVSGSALLWDQSQVRRLAERLGYDFADFVIYDPRFGRPPLARLKAQASRLDAEAVIVPSAQHFEGGRIPVALAARIDVITVNAEP